MKSHLLWFGWAAFIVSGQADAQCPCASDLQVKNTPILGQVVKHLDNLLVGNTVCAEVGNDKWQEFHSGTSGAADNLIDYKLGPRSKTDPSGPVGKWTISGQDDLTIVTYNYGSGGTYAYKVCRGSGTVSRPGPPFAFCSAPPGTSVTNARFVTGQRACS